MVHCNIVTSAHGQRRHYVVTNNAAVTSHHHHHQGQTSKLALPYEKEISGPLLTCLRLLLISPVLLTVARG